MKPDLRSQLFAIAAGAAPELAGNEVSPSALVQHSRAFGALAQFQRAHHGEDDGEGEALDAPAGVLAPLP
jgi:hypothetical protein